MSRRGVFTGAVVLTMCMAFAPCARTDDGERGAQSIAPLRHLTPNYELTVFSAGHFAVRVGGAWMPGCICLNVNNTPQYRTEALADMQALASALPNGRRIVITGHLTDDVAFTETIEATPDAVALVYEVEALRDMERTNIRVTAGPELEKLAGREYRLTTAEGERSGTFPPEEPVSVSRVRAITWPDVGRRDARTVFERCVASNVRLTAEGVTYTAVAVNNEPLRAGEKVQVALRFEAIPRGDAASWVPRFAGAVDDLRFGVTGVAGLLHNVRTNHGSLIQYLSINEANTHQVGVGRTTGDAWGGVRVVEDTPGESALIEATGRVVNTWQERIEAGRLAPGRQVLRWHARRALDEGPRRLRVLMYVAQWLEAQRNPYVIIRPDGVVVDHDDGERLWFGMPPDESEQGLGRYRELGEFPAGTEVVVPMASRGEIMRVRLAQPMLISGFRFEIYFRGLWFQTLDDSAADVGLDITLERMPEQRAGPLTIFTDELTHSTSLLAGGIPLLEAMELPSGEEQALWEWQGSESAARGEVTLPAEGDLRLHIPDHLRGAALSIHSSGSEPLTRIDGVPLRLGAELPPIELEAGTRLEMAPTALERVGIRTERPARLKLSCDQTGVATLALRGLPGGARVAVDYRRVSNPTPDPIAMRPAPYAREPQPGPYGGLEVISDRPTPGDVTVRTPWWEVVHSAARGGAITSIRFTNGTSENILREPIATTLVTDRPWTDVADAAARLRVLSASPTVAEIEARGHLRDADGAELCAFTHRYRYRPMLVRRTCSYALPAEGVACTGLAVGSMRLGSWLDEAVSRGPGPRTTWHRAVFPGPTVFEERDFSQYMCLFRRGVEGIDWLPAADLPQWRGFGTGEPGGARYAIAGAANGDPLMVIEPIAMGSDPVKIAGQVRFESYLSLPQVKRCLQRCNFVACLNTGECSQELLQLCADYGVTDIMLGAGNTPGTFKLSDEADARRAVERANALGLAIYPFDPFQLVNRRAPIWEHHEEWGREELRDGKPELRVYSSYGDYFCPTAEGFREALKTGYARLVESCDFTGLYHDFTHPYTCWNTRHYPAPHINTDGVLDVILWDREYLGPDRVFCGHTGWTPTLLFQDLCTVTAIFEEYPAATPLPLHMTPAQGEFVNAAQMTLVSSFLARGAVGPGEEESIPPPSELVDAYLARCALVGIFPWAHSGSVGAIDSYDLPDRLRPWLRLFAIRDDADLATMQFLPWHRQTGVLIDNPYVRAATYWNTERAIIVIANSESSRQQEFTMRLLPEQFGWPADAALTVRPARDCVGPERVGDGVFRGSLPGYGYEAWHVIRN